MPTPPQRPVPVEIHPDELETVCRAVEAAQQAIATALLLVGKGTKARQFAPQECISLTAGGTRARTAASLLVAVLRDQARPATGVRGGHPKGGTHDAT